MRYTKDVHHHHVKCPLEGKRANEHEIQDTPTHLFTVSEETATCSCKAENRFKDEPDSVKIVWLKQTNKSLLIFGVRD